MENTLFDTIGNLYKLTHKNGHENGIPLANKLWKIRHPGKAVIKDDDAYNEYKSWINSLPKLIADIHFAGLDYLDLIMEYGTTDGNGRIDAILVGKDHNNKDQILLVENKQWSNGGTRPSDNPADVNIKVSKNEWSKRIHPLTQLRAYRYSLTHSHSYLKNGKTSILIAAYVHNLINTHILTDGIYASNKYGRFMGIPYEKFIFGKKSHKDRGNGRFARFLRYFFKDVNNRTLTFNILSGVFSYNEIDLRYINNITPNEEQYELAASIVTDLDDLVTHKRTSKKIIIIRGSAGTGKTVMGFYLIHLYRKLYKEHYHREANDSMAVYSTALSFEIHSYIDYKYHTRNFVPYAASLTGHPDLLIVDESQRVSNVNELQQYLNKTRLLILLEDDKQIITPRDNGSFKKFKHFIYINNIDHKYTRPLHTEMRNNGGKQFTEAVINLLYGYKYDTGNEPFHDYDVLNCGGHLTRITEQMKSWQQQGNLVKWVAPYCWHWSQPRNGKPIDIVFSDAYGTKFRHPWNPKNNNKEKNIQGEWLNSKNEINPVACVYTAQGLQFDYEGMIWWNDLVWKKNADNSGYHWYIDYSKIQDPAYLKYLGRNPTYEMKLKIKECIINDYYILLTRARNGIAIWFKDSTTERHVRDELNMTDMPLH